METTNIERAARLKRQALAAAAAAAAALAGAAPAQAGIMDFLFGGTKPAEAAAPAADRTQQRSWLLGDFTEIRVVKAEAGAAPNSHPASIPADQLRRMLAEVRLGRGDGEALFYPSELDELVEPLGQALRAAGPGDDVLLLSSSRRGTGFIGGPTAITARLFVADGRLALIVHDSRFEFYNAYRGSGKAPAFQYGSRSKAGPATIGRVGAAARRSDWIEIGLAGDVAPAAAAAAPAPAVAPAPAAAPAAVAPAPAAATAPAARPEAAPARPAAPGRPTAEEVEQRLLTLKRLRDRGLISEAEYNDLRRDILRSL